MKPLNPNRNDEVPVETDNEPFHAHLNECEQCRRNPFGLCPEGGRRLRQQATGHDPGPQPPRSPQPDPLAAFNAVFDAIFASPRG
jgi:hypothetical protein